MNTKRLFEILSETTRQYRKGPAIVESISGQVRVVEIFAMEESSAIPSNFEQVDCHFFIVGVDKELANKHKDEFIEILSGWPLEYQGQAITRLEEGPSYILVGGILGDQGVALQLFALGEVLGLWKVMTPESLGVSGELANEFAGRGLIMIDGFRKQGDLVNSVPKMTPEQLDEYFVTKELGLDKGSNQESIVKSMRHFLDAQDGISEAAATSGVFPQDQWSTKLLEMTSADRTMFWYDFFEYDHRHNIGLRQEFLGKVRVVEIK